MLDRKPDRRTAVATMGKMFGQYARWALDLCRAGPGAMLAAFYGLGGDRC